MTSLGSEKGAVQKPLIKYAKEVGWEYVNPEEALIKRGGSTGLVFKDVFRDKITGLNKEFMSSEIAEELIKQIERIPPTIEGNLVMWEYLKGLRNVFVPQDKRERNVTFMDSIDTKKNMFHVTDEFEFTNGTKTNRYDVVFLINGVPVLFIETKAAHKIEGMADALDQVRRYHRETPEMMMLLQIYALTHILRFYYSATWNLSGKDILNWKTELGYDSYSNYENLVKKFLEKEHIVRIIFDFILFTRQDDELKKAVLRPHQMRAVDRILDRAGEEKTRGLIWHTQGSGKTYTMMVAAKKILENPVFENPTVVMLVDRNELEAQLFGNLRSVGFENAEIVESKRHLREVLSSDRRGLIVSMIHKFDGIPANLNLRKNIFILVDEAHRTTGGKLGNYLMGALPNATYIGFTGTPIDKTVYGRGTFITFGKDDPPHGYLDKYSIVESIEDGTTVKLHYSLAPSDMTVDKETLEKEFLNLAETQGLSDIESLNKVLEKAVTLRNMLKNKNRVANIAKYVAEHFRNYVEPLGYKAFLVGVDREACALYKEALDKHLPPDYSKVVYSSNFNDLPELSKYHLSEEEEKIIRKTFKKPGEMPKILIVTEKLLTGFDAPILYCMYLDKPMRDHVLLQAIARVNRPYENDAGKKKPSGFVLDFVGIFSDLEKALAFDSADIKGVIDDIQVLKDRFVKLMDQASENYISLIKEKAQDKQVEVLLEHFRTDENRQKYYKLFRDIADIYEILSPDSFLRPYLEDYEILLRMYRILKEAYDPGVTIDREFSKKTSGLVQQHTSAGIIKSSLDIYEINEDTIKKIEESKVSDVEKVFNLLKSIQKDIALNVAKEPYLISIGEKAEIVLLFYKERQQSTKETLKELENLIKQRNTAKKDQIQKGMPGDIFSIFWILKESGVDNPEDKVRILENVIRKYPFWTASSEQERYVKQEMYRILVKDISIDAASDIVTKITRIMKGAKNGS